MKITYPATGNSAHEFVAGRSYKFRSGDCEEAIKILRKSDKSVHIEQDGKVVTRRISRNRAHDQYFHPNKGYRATVYATDEIA